MKIAFDGQLLLKGDKTGIAWNAHNMILELVKYPELECTIQCFRTPLIERLEEYQKAGCNIEYCTWFEHSLYKMLWAVLPVPYRLFFHTKPEITQFFNFTIPPGARGKRVVFIHDMAYQSCPDTVNKRTRVWLEISMKNTCRRADHILTVSAFSKEEILKYLPVSKECVSVVPNAVDHALYHMGYHKQQIQKLLERYGIGQDYFLYLGTIEPRKNLERLISAYEDLCRNRCDAPQLVIAGRKGWMCEQIYVKAQNLLLKNKIIFTGYIRQEDSPILLNGARAFVFPSLYEGFGMPPLEAMACGTPVITSNTTALAEIAGNAAVLVDPYSEQEISRAMERMIEEDALREALRVQGLKRAADYSWKKSAEALLYIYQNLCKE